MENAEWIDCKERNPDHYGDYLTINKSKFQHVACWTMRHWVRKDDLKPEGHTEITHWMPLPEPPR